MLAEERLAAIRGYVADVVGCSPDGIAAVSRFAHGNRHEVYKVSCADADAPAADLVVRISLAADPAEHAQAEREARVLESVGGLAAPPLYDFSPTSAWFDTPSMAMGFVPGRELALAEATPGQIERLGGLVADLHGHPVGALAAHLGESVDIGSYAARRLRSILVGMAWVRDPVDPFLGGRLRDAAASLEHGWERWRESESFNADEPLALLHGDIALGNVLWGPDPVLIDWEYARLGDPADEIAYLFDQSDLAAPLRSTFWRGYRERSRAEARVARVMERAMWWEPVTLLGSTLWWVERWVRRTEADAAGGAGRAATRESGYYLDQVVRRMERLDRLVGRQRPIS